MLKNAKTFNVQDHMHLLPLHVYTCIKDLVNNLIGVASLL